MSCGGIKQCMIKFLACFVLIFSEIVSHYGTLAGSKFTILFPQPFNPRDDRLSQPYLAYFCPFSSHFVNLTNIFWKLPC